MAELVYAHHLKWCPVRDVGSIPTPGTQFNILEYNAPLAQLVEQIPLKDKVEGSIPSGRTIAGVAELVYALVLGTSTARFEGSSPSSST